MNLQRQYMQHIWAQEFLTLMQEPHDLKFLEGTFITQVERAQILLDSGLNIHEWMQFDLFGKKRNYILLEKILMDCQQYSILKIVMSYIDKDFFQKLTYDMKCSMVSDILDKNFSDENKKELLNSFFDNGFEVIPNKVGNSKEIQWLEQGHHAIFDLIIARQKHFPWSYSYNGKTILNLIDDALVNSSEQMESRVKHELQIRLIELKDKISLLFNHDTLESILPHKSEGGSKTKI